MELKLGEDVLQLNAVVTAVPPPDDDGAPQPAELAKYRVQLTGAGQIKRGMDWDLKVPEATLKRDYAKFNKAGSYVNQHGSHVPSYMQSMQDKVGFFRRARWNEESKTVDADLVLARTPLAETFKAQLDLDLANNNSMVQFSAVYSYDFSETETKKNGNKHYVVSVDKIREVFSVDAVDRGAFPMKPLAALSTWRGDSSKEEEMAKEVEETAQKEQGGVDVTALIAENQKRDEELAALRAEHAARDEAQNKRFADQEARFAALEKVQNTRQNEAHFDSKVATLPKDSAGVAALRESIDFSDTDKDRIDVAVAPLLAELTAQGRTELDEEAIKVTQDVADSRKALLTAAVLGEELKEGDKKYEVLPVEKIIADQFDDKVAGHSPQEFWNALNQAYLTHGLTDAEVDAAAEGQPVARLGTSQVGIETVTNGSTAHAWATQLLMTIVNVARILHDGSEMTGWMNTLIPAMHRVTVPDFQNRFYRYTGTFGQLPVVGEGVQVPDVNVSDSFRVPVKPVKRQGKFYLTYEAVMNSPTAALRSLAMAMGISISSTDYNEVMNLMFGVLAADGGAGFTRTDGYEKTGAFIVAGNNNLSAADDNGWSYSKAVAAIDGMYQQTAYGEDNFSLAGMLNPAVMVVAPQFYGAAEATTRAVLEPGTANNAVNRLNGIMVIPNSTSGLTNPNRFFAVVARPRDAQLFVYSTLNGQPPSFQPNVLRDDNANRNRITYKASNIRRINVVDYRAVYVTKSNNAVTA